MFLWLLRMKTERQGRSMWAILRGCVCETFTWKLRRWSEEAEKIELLRRCSVCNIGLEEVVDFHFDRIVHREWLPGQDTAVHRFAHVLLISQRSLLTYWLGDIFSMRPMEIGIHTALRTSLWLCIPLTSARSLLGGLPNIMHYNPLKPWKCYAPSFCISSYQRILHFQKRPELYHPRYDI